MTLSNLPYAGQRPVRSARRADRFHQLHAPIVYRVLEFLVDRGELLLAVDVDQRNHASAVATSTFGVIERLIDQTDGTIQRHVDRRTSYRETRAPDGHRATDALAMPHDGLAAHGTEQSMRREIQLRIAHRAQQNQELFASPAQQGLVVAQRVGKTLAGSGQHGVTRRMPERVVDALEVIHIDQQRTADERSIALLGQNPLVEVPAGSRPRRARPARLCGAPRQSPARSSAGRYSCIMSWASTGLPFARMRWMALSARRLPSATCPRPISAIPMLNSTICSRALRCSLRASSRARRE